jgi:hypothetical protein
VLLVKLGYANVDLKSYTAQDVLTSVTTDIEALVLALLVWKFCFHAIPDIGKGVKVAYTLYTIATI